jgi:hypothetical protein
VRTLATGFETSVQFAGAISTIVVSNATEPPKYLDFQRCHRAEK